MSVQLHSSTSELSSYLDIESENIQAPTSTKAGFMKAVQQAIDDFEDNLLISRLKTGNLAMNDYHNLLLTLFNQTYFSPTTFALAGSNINSKMHRVRDYLIKHAAEERTHWTWVISDLRSTGYLGTDPRGLFPPLACQSYISFQHFLAVRFPLGRLGMATVLEGIGGKMGTKYGKELMTTLRLKPNQAQFFLQHGELDVGHSEEIISVIEGENVSPQEWAQLCHVAEMTGKLYKAMYDSAANM